MNTWTTLVGSWGDSLCSYGKICKLLKDRGEEKANVVYFGLDQNICEFLKAQPNVDKVSWLKIDTPSVIGKYIGMATRDAPQWLLETGLKEQLPDIVPTHVTLEDQHKHSNECYRDFDPQLPQSFGNWDEFLADKSPYILLQPYSIQSCTYEEHWPFWKEAMKHIVEKTDKNIVIVGEMPENPEKLKEIYDTEILDHPKVTCIIGQTRSMLDVLHIANNASAIITTSNALSCWSVVKKIPAIVTCNKIIQEATPYYYNWIHAGKNVVLAHDTSFDVFKAAVSVLNFSPVRLGVQS